MNQNLAFRECITIIMSSLFDPTLDMENQILAKIRDDFERMKVSSYDPVI
jgi:hypothetical protein